MVKVRAATVNFEFSLMPFEERLHCAYTRTTPYTLHLDRIITHGRVTFVFWPISVVKIECQLSWVEEVGGIEAARKKLETELNAHWENVTKWAEDSHRKVADRRVGDPQPSIWELEVHHMLETSKWNSQRANPNPPRVVT